MYFVSQMIFAVEIYCITTLAVTLGTRGLSQKCYYYCKHFSHQSRILQKGCNCTDILSHQSINNEIYYEPHKLMSTQSPPNKGFHLINPVSEMYDQTNIVDTFHKEIYNIPNSSFPKYKRSIPHVNNSKNNIVEFPLYLDIVQNTPVNNSNSFNLKEELKHIFERIRASENHLSECLNLHIYIFSKNNDKFYNSHTNWGQHIKQDNLSRSEVLTEIQNKCDRPNTIVHESIFEIKQRKGLEYDFTRNNHDATDNNNNYKKEEFKTIHDDFSTTLQNRDLYRIGSDIHNNILDIPKAPVNGITKVSVGNQHDDEEKYFNTAGLKSISSLVSRESLNFRTVKHDRYPEKDLFIPKIITKEFSDNSVTSIIDGFETLPNSDFVINDNNTFIEDNKISDESTPSGLTDIHKSDLVEDIKGKPYFTFGNSQIPARFIQNSDGEMHLAIDGFSLCDQMTQEQENKFNFIALFCDCIKLYNKSRLIT